MRSNAIIRIILFSIAIVVLLGILGIGIAADTFMFLRDSGTEGTAASSGTADADTVRNLHIEWAAGDITVRHADVSQITLSESGTGETDPMVFLQSGNTLKVTYTQDETFSHVGTLPSKDLLIEVPLDWECGALEVESAAANLIVDTLTIGKVDFDGASGQFKFHGCSVDAMDLDTASGDIWFDGSLNTLDCDAVSADCEIVLTNCPSRIEMDLVSGSLDLSLPERCGFTASLGSLSGRLDSDFEITKTANGFTSGDGACRIDISAMSGDVFIHKLEAAQNCDH